MQCVKMKSGRIEIVPIIKIDSQTAANKEVICSIIHNDNFNFQRDCVYVTEIIRLAFLIRVLFAINFLSTIALHPVILRKIFHCRLSFIQLYSSTSSGVNCMVFLGNFVIYLYKLLHFNQS